MDWDGGMTEVPRAKEEFARHQCGKCVQFVERGELAPYGQCSLVSFRGIPLS